MPASVSQRVIVIGDVRCCLASKTILAVRYARLSSGPAIGQGLRARGGLPRGMAGSIALSCHILCREQPSLRARSDWLRVANLLWFMRRMVAAMLMG